MRNFYYEHAKTLYSPFDMLRVNGLGIAIVGAFPFVLSLSKHVSAFFSNLLEFSYVPPHHI